MEKMHLMVDVFSRASSMAPLVKHLIWQSGLSPAEVDSVILKLRETLKECDPKGFWQDDVRQNDVDRHLEKGHPK